MSKTRAWCFTINNYTEADLYAVQTCECAYICYEPEVGEQGTPHIQGYVYFTNPRTMKGVERVLGGRASLRIAKGTAAQNRTYCSKDGKLSERGEMPEQGKRTDIDDMKELIQNGEPLDKVIWSCTSYQSAKFAMTLAANMKPPKRDGIVVRWYWGPAGTGKTRAAEEEAGDDAFKPVSIKWWDGYRGEKKVIIDDFRICQHGYSDIFALLLKILDRYSLRVEVKGGTLPLAATEFWITSCREPDFYVPAGEDKKQIIRRINVLKHFSGTEVAGVIVDPATPEGDRA